MRRDENSWPPYIPDMNPSISGALLCRKSFAKASDNSRACASCARVSKTLLDISPGKSLATSWQIFVAAAKRAWAPVERLLDFLSTD